MAWGWAPWSDLFRVDILNTIGISMMLMAVLCWIVLAVAAATRLMVGISAGAIGLTLALMTPLMWTTWRPDWLPWPIESYINGVHNLGQPQAWLFPIFPWTGFAFAGLAVGFFLLGDWAKKQGALTFVLAGASGLALIYGARWLDHRPRQIYAVYDFWHTSPNFFVIRIGLLLLILAGAYLWCRWGLAAWGFSPLAQIGKTSLLVYWVHIEFVYGRFSILAKRSQDIGTASVGLLTIFLAMLLLSLMRTKLKGRGWEKLLWMRKPAGA